MQISDKLFFYNKYITASSPVILMVMVYGRASLTISILKNKFIPRNTACMPVVKFIFRLELGKIGIV